MPANSWSPLVLVNVFILCPAIAQAYLVWVSSPQNRAVALGQDTILPCQARWAGPNDTAGVITYTWSFNGGNLTSKASRFYNNSLFISAVSLGELGNYSCIVTRGRDQSSSAPETLTATAVVIEAYIRTFFLDPVSLGGYEGEGAVLTCVTGTSAPSLQVHWLRNGEDFTLGKALTATFGDHDTSGLSVQLSMKLIFTISDDTVGLFQCVAYNEDLKIDVLSQPANVTMKTNATNDAPVIEWNLPRRLIVVEGHNLILSCKVTKNTSLTVVWYLGAYRIDQSRTSYVLPNNSLVFVPVQAKDSGNYSCVVQNSKVKTQSPYVELSVAFLGVSFLANPSNTSALHGQDVVLQCSPPKSIPAATVTWYKDYAPINLQSARLKVIGNDLHLTSVVKNDSGLYYCVAFNRLTVPSSRTSRVASVRVEGPPIMAQPPINTKVVRSKLLHLTCLVDSDPTPDTTWQFEGLPLTQSSKVSLLDRGQELWITNVGKEWAGRFTCLSRNKYGFASADAFVSVLVAPVSLKPIGNLTAVSGDSVLIPCTVVSDLMPDIHWFFNGVRVSLDESVAAGQNLTLTYRYPDLHIQPVRPEHGGKYVCTGTNEAGNASSSGWLVVHVPPAIVQAPTDVTAVIGTSVTLSCQSQGSPDPSIHWLYNSSRQLPDNAQLKNNNSTIMVLPLSWTGVGSYACVAHNVAGTTQASAVVRLMIPPKIEVVHFPQTPVRIQTRFNLSCAASGLPTPAVEWTQLGKPLEASLNGRVRLPQVGVLVVEFAWKNDSGLYECRASSSAGQQRKAVSIIVYGVPSPPVLLRALPLSSESVYLIWQWLDHGDASERVDKFEISFWDKTSDVASVYSVTPLRNETRAEVLDLQPYMEYMFSVSAVNDAGSGPASNVLSATTLQSRPSRPVNLKVLSLTSTNITLSWEVPTSPNGIVKMYELRYRRTRDTQTGYLVVNITDPQFPSNDILLSPLLPYTDYDAQVRACNIDMGQYLWGNYSSITFHTLASKPSLPPQQIKVDAVDQFSLLVTWQQLPVWAQNGPILFNHVYVNYKESKPLARVKLNASITSYTITGLFPWRYYSVTLAVESEAGLGPVSGSYGARTLPLVAAAAPANFQVTASSASSLQLSWQALQGDLVTCNITAYVLEYRKQENSTWDRLPVPSGLSSSSFSYVLESLLPWTWYECQVAALCQALGSGLGPFTEALQARTLQGVSSAVTLLSYTVNSTFILLSWQPPKDVRGVLIGYRVVYTAIDSDNVSNAVEINSTSQSTSLKGLSPRTGYSISVAARNSAGSGQEVIVRVTTLPLPQTSSQPTTNDSMLPTGSFNHTAYYLGQSNNSDITKHLASIVAGSIVGAIALIIVTAVICIKCMKYRQKQRLNYDVDSETVGVEGTNYRTLEPSSDIATISSRISFTVTDSQSSTTVTDSQSSTTVTDSQSSTTVTQSSQAKHSALENVAGAGENYLGNSDRAETKEETKEEKVGCAGTKEETKEEKVGCAETKEETKEEKRRYSIRRPSLPILSQASPYSMLQEDHSFSTEDLKGFDNPGFVAINVDSAEDVPTEVNLRQNSSGQHLSVVLSDTVSVSSETMRRNRMHSESAAAIAVLRANQAIFPDDTDTLMDFESIGAEVVFNERTTL